MKPDQIEILGIIVLEPAVSFSDIITGLISLMLAYSLWRKKSPYKSLQLFMYYFIFMGLATVVAGIIGHGLLYYLSPDWKIVGWSISAIGLFFLEQASLEYFKIQLGPGLLKNLKILTNLQLGTFFILLIFPNTRSFTLVQFNATFCYIGIILPLYSYSIYVWKNPASWLVIAAITLASSAALVYNAKITVNQWFNHHVFTHVLMAMYVLLIYYAVVRLHSTFKDSTYNFNRK
jgi:hypothetical protein